MSKVLIIGGVAGGATTAARLRRRDEHIEIIIFERGQYMSYANCGLPYYIGESIKKREKLFVQTPQSFSKRFRVDVRTEHEVIRINADQKSVEVKDIKTGKLYEESYDKLVLSPGAEPIKPPLTGIDLPNIYTIRNVPDTDKIKKFVDETCPKRAVIVGAGFIGLEMAESLHDRGILVTIVEMADQVMTPLDFEMASAVHQHLKTKHVEFYLKDAVDSFEQKGKHIIVKLRSGKRLITDMVILSIGVRPETTLCKDAGVEIGESGGIKVDPYLQTTQSDIYAIGDAIEFNNPLINKSMTAYLAGPANKQGRIVANNIIDGNKWQYNGTIATAIAKVFDLTVASTGLSEKALIAAGISYKASIIHASSHAGYYPGAKPMSIKIQFTPKDGKLLGGQIVGYEGVDKRIDLLATVVKQGGTVYDLMDIEHAYAPPYSSAKDPVNLAGFVAENILDEHLEIVHWKDIIDRDPQDYLLDVRTKGEFRLGTIEGCTNIPLDDLRERLDEIPKNQRIVVFCAVGLRGYLACRILMQRGFENVVNLSGGFTTWQCATKEQSNEALYDHVYIEKDDVIYSSDPHESI